MKSLILTLIYFLSYHYYAQLPDLKLEKEQPYYSFIHKLSNETKCLRAYFDHSEGNYGMLIKLAEETVNHSFTLSKDKIISYVGLFPFNKFSYSGECIDTLKCGYSSLKLKLVSDVYPPNLLSLLRGKVLSAEFTGNIDLYFISPNEYEIVFRNLEYHYTTTKGLSYTPSIVSFGELYSNAKATQELSKKDLLFFENITKAIEDCDKLIFKAISRSVMADL
jgi:hypothetical protein